MTTVPYETILEQLEESLAVQRLAVALNVELERLGLSTHWENLTAEQQSRMRERATIALRLDSRHMTAAKVRARIKLGQARETCEQNGVYTGILSPTRYQAEACVTGFLDGLLQRWPDDVEDQ